MESNLLRQGGWARGNLIPPRIIPQPGPGQDVRPSGPSSAASVSRASPSRASPGRATVTGRPSPKTQGQKTEDVPVSVPYATVQSVVCIGFLFSKKNKKETKPLIQDLVPSFSFLDRIYLTLKLETKRDVLKAPIRVGSEQ